MPKSDPAKKYILVACGSGIATGTLVGERVREICRENGIAAEVQQCGIREIAAKANDVDIILTTARYKGRDVGKPVVNALAILTGIGVEEFEKKLLDLIKG